MTLADADHIAGQIVEALSPHTERIAIAGSIRRRRPEPHDIEIVAIPKPYDVGLFKSGIATVVEDWPKVKGELGPACKYTQRLVPVGGLLAVVRPYHERGNALEPEKVKLDLFFATPANWGLILAIRTGSAAYSHKVLACGWRRRGYVSSGGVLCSDLFGEREIREEEDLFRLLGIPWALPEQREVEE